MAAALCGWLKRRFGEVAVVGSPARLSGGFDFWIYSVQFAGTGLPAPWTQPLVARVPPIADRFELLSRECELQTWVVDHGYPAPPVVALLAPGEVFESPVQLVRRVPGTTMTDAMTSAPWRLPRRVAQLGRLHAELHSLPLPDWAHDPDRSVLDRRLGLVRFVLERVSNPELEQGVAQVERLRPQLTTDAPVICHGDFHPMNVLVSESASVIDWTDAGIGDAHCDVARTSWLFRFAAAVAPRRVERSVLRPIAPLLARGYLRAYRLERAFDPARLRLWMAPHLLHAWAMFVADEHELVGPSRAGDDFRPSMTNWARQQFHQAIAALGGDG